MWTYFKKASEAKDVKAGADDSFVVIDEEGDLAQPSHAGRLGYLEQSFLSETITYTPTWVDGSKLYQWLQLTNHFAQVFFTKFVYKEKG